MAKIFKQIKLFTSSDPHLKERCVEARRGRRRGEKVVMPRGQVGGCVVDWCVVAYKILAVGPLGPVCRAGLRLAHYKSEHLASAAPLRPDR
jgi:hypothetical protein